MSAPEEDLLAAVPFGGLLSGVLRVLLAEERREEFVGDLVEQARADLADQPLPQIGLWLWGQTLHSAPSLLVARARRLARGATGLSHPGARPLPAVGSLLGYRAETRSWSLPMAISVSVHALALSVLFVATLGGMEELQAPWVRIGFPHPPSAAAALTIAPEVPPRLEARHHRKPRFTLRPIASVAPPAFAPVASASLTEAPIEDPEVREVIVILPPVVADKRCVSCPKPTLPPAFVRLGAEQRIDVKTCVGARGNVTSVDVVRGLGPLADAGVVDTVRNWRFTPHSVGDHPVPFCYPTRFVFTMN